MENKPIKRHKVLQPLSHEHHYTLLLCWKIRTGLTKNVAPERIEKYALWFYQNHMLPHFELEEKYIFTILPQDNEQIKQAIAEHQTIKQLFESNLSSNLLLIANNIDNHVRFEERFLLNEVQKMATEEQLQLIEQYHSKADFVENRTDEFWL